MKLRFHFAILLLLIFSWSSLQSQVPIRVMQYNLLFFGDCSGVTTSSKYQWLGTILEHVKPDILAVNELIPQTAYLNGIRVLSFDYTSSIASFPITNQANSNIVNGLFYNTDKFTPAQTQTGIIANSLRDINVYRLIYLPSISNGATDTLFVTCIVAHFKAGQSSADASLRAVAANSIMSYLADVPDEEYVLLMGDFNVYNHQEAAFQALINGPQPSERLIDVSGKGNGWNGASHAIIHTQSTRSSGTDCGSGGGMDDRFDIILASQSLIDATQPIRIDSSSYRALGNNGLSYDRELSCTNNNTVPVEVCVALKQMSDHLPVVVDLIADASVSIDRQLNAFRLAVSPQDEAGVWQVRLPQGSGWMLSLGNMNGARLLDQRVTEGNTTLDLDLRHLPAGWYWIRLADARGNQAWSKVFRP